MLFQNNIGVMSYVHNTFQVNKKLLAKHIQENTGKRVILKDLHNLGASVDANESPEAIVETLKQEEGDFFYNIYNVSFTMFTMFLPCIVSVKSKFALPKTSLACLTFVLHFSIRCCG